jgi:hypothetical protein
VDDKTILQHIEQLVNDEHALLQTSRQQGLSAEQEEQLQQMNVTLDQLWDLLRQRRARREFHENPDDAQVRDPKTVEHYQQ